MLIRNDRYHVEPVSKNEGYIVLEDFDLRIRYAGRIRWEGKQGRLEIIYVNGRWLALVPIEVGREHQNPTNGAMLSPTTKVERAELLILKVLSRGIP